MDEKREKEKKEMEKRREKESEREKRNGEKKSFLIILGVFIIWHSLF